MTNRAAALAGVRTARFVIEKFTATVWDPRKREYTENSAWRKRYDAVVASLTRSGFTYTETEKVFSETVSRITITAERVKPESVRKPQSFRVSNGAPLTVEQCAKQLEQAQTVYRAGIAQWDRTQPAPDLGHEFADLEYWRELLRLASERKGGKRTAVAA